MSFYHGRLLGGPKHILVWVLLAMTGAFFFPDSPVLASAPKETTATGPFTLTEKSCASTRHYTIALLLSVIEKPKNRAYITGAKFRVKAINAAGGIGGRPICLVALDDRKQAALTVRIVEQALLDKTLVAMVGLSSSSNARAVVKTIGKSKVPLLSDISVDRLFRPYRNIFTMSKAVSDDTRAFSSFLTENYSSAMFVGTLTKQKDGTTSLPDLFATEFLSALQLVSDKVTLMAPYWIEKTDGPTLDAIVADIRKNRPDVLCLAVWTGRAATLVKRLAAENITVPVFLATGSITGVARLARTYKGPLFQLGGSIPNLVSERLASLNRLPDIRQLRTDLKNHLGDGLIYADLLAMIARSAQAAGTTGTTGDAKPQNVDSMRRHIVSGLTRYREGRKVFPGLWRNWSFSRARASARNAFILWTPDVKETQRLWRVQTLRSGTGLRKIPVAYASVDLVRIHSVNTNNHSFDAGFYLSLSANPPVTLDKFAFSNAVKSDSGEPLVHISEINPDQSTSGAKLYNVKGRFRFLPKLSRYPFDRQRFSVAFKPVDTASPFLIQPPKPELLDREAEMDGWVLEKGRQGQYIGWAQDIITTVVNHGKEQQIQPYYKFNFTWVAKRLTLDYYVRVVIPLALIMLVAYFSVFLPSTQVESVVGMQVTALLSTIALYFSIPKLNTETATLSDQIFVFAESVIVILIMLSIIRVNMKEKTYPLLGQILKGIQVIGFPVLAWFMFQYVTGVSAGRVKTFSEAGMAEVMCPLLPGSGSPVDICRFFGV